MSRDSDNTLARKGRRGKLATDRPVLAITEVHQTVVFDCEIIVAYFNRVAIFVYRLCLVIGRFRPSDLVASRGVRLQV